ncbi:MAG: double-strand break repair helicase AddA [Sphingopyxis sp.]
MNISGTPKRLTNEQAIGAYPHDNAWMSASAGTGKTQVLSARILRLLLEGVRPQSILAITFTKAGAAEMAFRIREKLGAWVQMKDAELMTALHEIHAPGHLDKDMLSYARTLFARVIDAPGGGLAIQTIHSFCQSLLASFPDEAGIAAGFRAIEEREIVELQRETLSALIAGARASGDMGFLDRLHDLALDLGDGRAQAYLFRCAAAHKALDALPAGVGPWLRGQFDLPSDAAPSEWLASQCCLSELDEQAIRNLIDACIAWGRDTGLEYAGRLSGWLAADKEARAETIDTALSALLTDKGTLRNEYRNPKQLGGVEEIAQRIADTLAEKRDSAAHMALTDKLAGALAVGQHFARAYQSAKRRDGVLDFDDLIEGAISLLESDTQKWIRYKLDARIDHILVDEAQDTNGNQWRIVRALSEEFFAGDGAKIEALRTLFVVGDTKQAIYGFQGTSPIYFDAARQLFKQLGRDADRAFNDIAIDVNFRSSPPILKLVDRLIADAGPEQFGLDVDSVNHSAQATHASGRVTIWPLEPYSSVSGQAENRSDESDGDDSDSPKEVLGEEPLGDDETGEEGWIDKATRRVAGKISQTVRGWIDEGIDGSPVAPSDVMILVRKRSDIAALIVSRLISQNVPVAGVDRLKLQSPIAVQDLLAAMRFPLQPHDDLNLASLLVSPLIGWSHDDLIEHGWRMDGQGKFPVSLWRHINSQSLLSERLSPLHDLLAMAGYAGPHRFIETILSGPMMGRSRLLARLGHAALDPLEELVTQALVFENREGASLHRFLNWFDAGTNEIKRELEDVDDAVRVMTVHGAKGLQARIIILADAAGNPMGKPDEIILWRGDDVGEIPLIATNKAKCPAALQAKLVAKEADDMKEHMRLLYVAATRAERMLFVAGSLPFNDKLPAGNWYSAIENAAQALGGEAAPDPVWGSALTYAVGGSEDRRINQSVQVTHDAIDIPAWASAISPQEPRPFKPLAPSSKEDYEELSVSRPPPTARQAAAMARGTMIHALFERLPQTAPENRRAAAMRWLNNRAHFADATDYEAEAVCEAMVDSVLAVLHDPAFADLFGPDSLAEVPFSALVDGRVIAGTVDRLMVNDTEVRVIDFKSGGFVPDCAENVPQGYLRQMAAYVAALRVIFPAHTVSASLLFSEAPRLITLPDTLIEEHKPKLAVA